MRKLTCDRCGKQEGFNPRSDRCTKIAAAGGTPVPKGWHKFYVINRDFSNSFESNALYVTRVYCGKCYVIESL